MKKILLSAAFVAVILSHHAFPATVVFGNLGANGSNSLNVNVSGPYGNLHWGAQGFTTGTSSLLTVSAITLGLSFDATTNAVMKLYSDNSGKPGSEITSAATNVTSESSKKFWLLDVLSG